MIAGLARRLLGREEAPVTARDLVHVEGSLRMYRYRRGPEMGPAAGAPVVLVYSWINRPTVFDLLPGRSVAGSLLEAGRDVFLLDWGAPGALEAGLGLGAHVARLERAVRKAVEISCTSDVRPSPSPPPSGRGNLAGAALVGYCLGGTAALCLAAVAPEVVRSLVLLATPVRFDAGGLLALWARASSVDPRAFAIGRSGNVPGAMLRELLRWQDPVGGVMKWARLLERARDAEFRAAFVAQERWANECVDVPGRLFEDLIQGLYREDRLFRGALDVGGKAARLAGLRTPVLNVISESDRIVPPAASLALSEAVGPESRVETLRAGGGHIGMTVGKRAAGTTHRAIIEFLSRTAA